MSYETIKRNYEQGLWNKVMVKNAVKKGVITKEQYELITGEKYNRINAGEINVKGLMT